jgi:hypothetical protein
MSTHSSRINRRNIVQAVATQNSETCRNPRDFRVPAIPLSA